MSTVKMFTPMSMTESTTGPGTPSNLYVMTNTAMLKIRTSMNTILKHTRKTVFGIMKYTMKTET